MLIIRKSNFINTASGMVTLYKWPSGAQVERELSQSVHRTATYRVTIPDSVLIKFGLLMMSMTLLETCRGL